MAAYDELFAEYLTLHDHFGRGGNDVMHRLEAAPPRGGRGGTATEPDVTA